MSHLIKFVSLVLIVVSVLNSPAHAKKEPFFGCNTGYQYEAKKDAARCVKQRKISFKPPLACNHRSNTNKLNRKATYRLAVDYKGSQDFCVVDTEPKKVASKLKKNLLKHSMNATFIPLCEKGYRLKSKRGKDACSRTNRQEIKPPTTKVSR
ncbi:MAG: hypothetical protein KUG78_15735 [Kangiellaceae bacterium]|nr:hypothetical protein [Kangiellaceae bacterium]